MWLHLHILQLEWLFVNGIVTIQTNWRAQNHVQHRLRPHNAIIAPEYQANTHFRLMASTSSQMGEFALCGWRLTRLHSASINGRCALAVCSHSLALPLAIQIHMHFSCIQIEDHRGHPLIMVAYGWSLTKYGRATHTVRHRSQPQSMTVCVGLG